MPFGLLLLRGEGGGQVGWNSHENQPAIVSSDMNVHIRNPKCLLPLPGRSVATMGKDFVVRKCFHVFFRVGVG